VTPFDNPPPVSSHGEEPGGQDALRGKHSGSQKRRRNRQVKIALDDAEYAAAEINAYDTGLSLASLGRVGLLGAPGIRAQRRPHVNALELAKATAALNKSGNVLNQIARVLNSGGPIHLAHECFAAIAENRAAAAAIRAAVGRRDRDDSQGNTAR